MFFSRRKSPDNSLKKVSQKKRTARFQRVRPACRRLRAHPDRRGDSGVDTCKKRGVVVTTARFGFLRGNEGGRVHLLAARGVVEHRAGLCASVSVGADAHQHVQPRMRRECRAEEPARPDVAAVVQVRKVGAAAVARQRREVVRQCAQAAERSVRLRFWIVAVHSRADGAQIQQLDAAEPPPPAASVRGSVRRL